MPFTNLPAANLSFSVLDASGNTSKTVFHVPFATAIATLIGAADVIQPLLAALTDGVITHRNVTFSYKESTPGAPVAGSRVEEKGTFIWTCENGRLTRFTIPAIKDSLLKQSGAIDRANVAVAAAVTAVTAVDALWCGADGSDIDSLYKAYQRFNSSTRNQLPTDA